jgi:hypothetical protein
MNAAPLDRRRFLAGAVSGLGTLAAGCDLPARPPHDTGGFVPDLSPPGPGDPGPAAPHQPYRGPNVVLVRFGGGVRRRETVTFPEKSNCPFILHELAERRGTLFTNIEIASAPEVETSHGQGTLFLLTGRYAHYQDVTGQFLGARFEAQAPTLFEYFRKHFDVPAHQALIINGEDRIDEEFYSFSNHHLFGVNYRSVVLSLYRFKTFLLRDELRTADLTDSDRAAKEERLRAMEGLDRRSRDAGYTAPELDRFWRDWREHYGPTGMTCPRGDRLLTALALRALRDLRPKLLMVNYQDTDYVHWGPAHFYPRAISVIDEGVRELYHAVQADPEYRDNTVFLVVPDCGRDNNRCAAVPFQHHFNSRSARQIFAVACGAGVARSRAPVDRLRQQISVTATVGRLMGFPTPQVDAGAGLLEEMLA